MGLRPAGRPPGAGTPWGDGFAHDGLFDLWTAQDWSLLSPDEYILLFPRLIPRAGEVPAVLRTRLESCVAARARRLAVLEPRAMPVVLRSRLPVAGGGEDDREWFTDDGAVAHVLRRAGVLRAAPGRAAAGRDLLTFLDRLLVDIQAGRVPAWDETSEALLAFGAGIHPAYLWPEAGVSPVRGLTAGWLGHLDRGRAALMPLAVADYILDALGGGSSDRQLIALAGGAASLQLLRRAARRRLSGRDAPVRTRPDTALLAFPVRSRARSAAQAGW